MASNTLPPGGSAPEEAVLGMKSSAMNITEVVLDETSREIVRAVVEEYDANPVGEAEGYASMSTLAAKLPFPVMSGLVEFRENVQAHALVVRGLPTGDAALLPTPDPGEDVPRWVAGIQAVSIGVLGTLGTPFAYDTQQGGRLINNIAPSALAVKRANVGMGSKEPFGWHTEDAFMPDPPSYLQLTCLRNNDKVGTMISGIAPGDLDAEAERLLRDPVFVVGTNPAQESWKQVSAGPILYGAVDEPFLRFNAVNTAVTSGAGPEHEAAVAELAMVLQKNAASVVTQPGDLLIVNNYKTCHARSSFTAQFDGTDRWLQRIVAYRDPRVVAGFTGFVGYPILQPDVAAARAS